jgi:hypothetical protein
MRFWDSSAVVPLLVEERWSKEARDLLEEDASILVWTFTPLEVLSALWRRSRSSELDDAQFAAARSGLTELESVWSAATDSMQVEQRARRLLAVHPLRAADALQLACALVASNERSDLFPFVTLDERLGQCARREGFSVPLSG